MLLVPCAQACAHAAMLHTGAAPQLQPAGPAIPPRRLSASPQWMRRTASRCSGLSAPCWRAARCRPTAARRCTSPSPTRCPCRPCETSCECAPDRGAARLCGVAWLARRMLGTLRRASGAPRCLCCARLDQRAAWFSLCGFLCALDPWLPPAARLLQGVHLWLPAGGAAGHPPHRRDPGRRRHARVHDPPQHPPHPARGPRRGAGAWSARDGAGLLHRRLQAASHACHARCWTCRCFLKPPDAPSHPEKPPLLLCALPACRPQV